MPRCLDSSSRGSSTPGLELPACTHESSMTLLSLLELRVSFFVLGGGLFGTSLGAGEGGTFPLMELTAHKNCKGGMVNL